jgi:hypothetical protein
MLFLTVYIEADHRLFVVLPTDVDPRLKIMRFCPALSYLESTLAKLQQNKRLQND